MIEYKFSGSQQSDFERVVRSRVNTYFKHQNLSKKANWNMFYKTLFTFGGYVIIYLLILFSGWTNYFVLFFLWGLLGLGQALVGMTIMHDVVHTSYTKNKWIRVLLEIPIISIGVESLIWRIEHNIIHHTYTNVEGIDQDINDRFVFRFSPHQKRRWFHQFQHIYATFIYGFLIIEWVTVKDFLKLFKYFRLGFIKSKLELAANILQLIIKKSVFYLLFLIIPLYVLNISGVFVVLMFFTMLVVAGITMTIVFQLAHVVPLVPTLAAESSNGKNNWFLHQMETTSNFANESRWLSFFLGGLNFQIEHHLFPDVCHVHYPYLAPIVKKTAEEHQIPYHYQRTFFGAISSHYALLKKLGLESN